MLKFISSILTLAGSIKIVVELFSNNVDDDNIFFAFCVLCLGLVLLIFN